MANKEHDLAERAVHDINTNGVYTVNAHSPENNGYIIAKDVQFTIKTLHGVINGEVTLKFEDNKYSASGTPSNWLSDSSFQYLRKITSYPKYCRVLATIEKETSAVAQRRETP